MDNAKALIIAAVIIAISVVVSPNALQSYKMNQCVNALSKVGGGSYSSVAESTCLQYIN